MISIRKGVFETNSSSTHSICINKNALDESKLPKYVYFGLDSFGWQVDTTYDTASYLWTALCQKYSGRTDFKLEEYKNHIYGVLASYGIDSDFKEPKEDCDCFCYVDHAEDLDELIKDLMNSDDKLMRFLFHGKVHTGNDNDSIDLPEEDPNEWEEYYKGN